MEFKYIKTNKQNSRQGDVILYKVKLRYRYLLKSNNTRTSKKYMFIVNQ